MMNISLEQTNRLNRLLIGIGGAAVIVLVAAVDYLFNSRLTSIAFFYLVPIILCTWFGGLVFGMVFSGVSFLFWAAVRLSLKEMHASGIVFYADYFVQSIAFGAATFFVSLVKTQLDQWKMAAWIDPLTRVLNLKFFCEFADREISRAKRYKRPFTLVIIDVDEFGMLNARLGRQFGDHLLRVIATAIMHKVRCTDIVGRLGPDEFGIIMPETLRENGSIAIKRLKKEIADEFQRHHWAITVSIRSVTFMSIPENASQMMQKTALLILDAKPKGKNMNLELTHS